jgi:hypothetical protein
MTEIVGTDGEFTTDEISFQIRNIIVQRRRRCWPPRAFPVLDMAANLADLGKIIANAIAPKIGEYGLSIPEFYIENISLPKRSKRPWTSAPRWAWSGDLNRYMQFNAAESLASRGQPWARRWGPGWHGAWARHGAEHGALGRGPGPPPQLPRRRPAAAPACGQAVASGRRTARPRARSARPIWPKAAAEGRLTRATMVWTAGQDGWKMAAETELARLLDQVPPPPRRNPEPCRRTNTAGPANNAGRNCATPGPDAAGLRPLRPCRRTSRRRSPAAARAALQELDLRSRTARRPARRRDGRSPHHHLPELRRAGRDHRGHPCHRMPVLRDAGGAGHRHAPPHQAAGAGALQLFTEAEARKAMVAWMGSLWFAPGTLLEYARKGRAMNGVYVPFWTFDADTPRPLYRPAGRILLRNPHGARSRVNGKMEQRQEQVRKTRWFPASGAWRAISTTCWSWPRAACPNGWATS